jgi:hypothetical protein
VARPGQQEHPAATADREAIIARGSFGYSPPPKTKPIYD